MTINNHLLANSHLNHIPIKILICPSVTGINRPGIPLRKHSGITIHDTGNSAKGADAVAHAAYVARVERGEGAIRHPITFASMIELSFKFYL